MSKLGALAIATGALAVTALTACSSATSGSGKVASPSGVSTAPSSTSASTPATPSTATASATTSSSAPSSASPPAALPSSATLKGINLRAGDLPAEWKAAAAGSDDDDSGDSADQAKLLACVGGTDTDSQKVTEEDSPEFDLDSNSISSSATSYKTQAAVAADTALLSNPKVNSCFASLLKTALSSSLPAGTTINSVKFTVTPGSGGGPSNVVGNGSGVIDVTSSGQRIVLYLQTAFITGNLIEAEVDFQSVGEPLDAALRAGAISKVAERAAAA